MSITSYLESTSRFISSASPVLSRFTSSSTCQPISVIVPAIIIHHSHTHTRLFDFSHFLIMGLLHSRLRTYLFNKSFPHKTSFIYWTASKCLRDNGTGLDLSRSSVYFLVSRFIIIFCLFRVVDIAGYLSAFYCTLNTRCRVVSYRDHRLPKQC